jgi:hypothetical protein
MFFTIIHGVTATRLERAPVSAGFIENVLHQPSRRAFATRRFRRFKMRQRASTVLVPILGEDDSETFVQLITARGGIILKAHAANVGEAVPRANPSLGVWAQHV